MTDINLYKSRYKKFQPHVVLEFRSNTDKKSPAIWSSYGLSGEHLYKYPSGVCVCVFFILLPIFLVICLMEIINAKRIFQNNV